MQPRGSWLIGNGQQPERAVLVGVERHKRELLSGSESLDELERLAESAGVRVVGRVLQVLTRPQPATFIGSGKVEEVRRYAWENQAQVIIFDEPLAPAQQRNLEQSIGLKVIDRSQLILDIFAQRARSLEGKLQVELAQLQYLLPRLTRQWQHLSRLGGGVGTRGPGETQLEVDRRKVRERVAVLRRRLREVARTRHLHRRSRADVPLPVVALVGYTNAGKSTLMNRLTAAHALVADQLFATLDPMVRVFRLPSGLNALLADTVGFIHKLPHGFIDAFKSTLEEVQTADLLLHVVDASHPQAEHQQTVVEAVLRELGADQKPRVLVFNKMDVVSCPPFVPPDIRTCLVSGRTGSGLKQLLSIVEEQLLTLFEEVRVRLPFSRGDLVARARQLGRVIEEHYSPEAIQLRALVPARLAGQLRRSAVGEAVE
ncbi:MAG: GTPase HflX [Candidatus Binatia bacterium]|nr:GTPase HflX [Candidatus Binatia bacterium]